MIILATTVTACSKATSEDPKTSTEPSSPSQTAISTLARTLKTAEAIKFTDAAFETKVRKEMGKLNGDKTVEEAKAVKKLDLGNESFVHRNANPDLDIKEKRIRAYRTPAWWFFSIERFSKYQLYNN
jgi:hypothetical protein